MRDHYDAIYLAPHLDDVALSCGGQISQATAGGATILIVTLTAGDLPDGPLSPFAAGQHAAWGLTETAVAVRRAEDLAACALLGAEALHWPLPDCIYRRAPDDGRALYTSNDALFGGLHPAEQPLVAQVAAMIAALPARDALVVPLALGNHADHWLMRLAAEQSGVTPLIYYEDYPYVQRSGLGDAVDPATGWRPTQHALSAAAIAARIAACAAYRSQIVHLFGAYGEMERLLRAQIAATDGERTWQRVTEA